MKNIFLCLLITLLTFGLAVDEAYAKRFGSGRSFGVQRSHSSMFSQKPSPAHAATAPRTNTSKWGGLLGGMLIGGLLTSLLMGHGLASGLLSWLVIGVVIFFLVNLWRNKMQPALQSGPSNMGQFFTNNFSGTSSANSTYDSSNSETSYPVGFKADDFLRDAKVKYIRLQAAFDQKNLQDLRDFTAPEVFAEIKMQLDERGDEPNKTEVLDLNAELLDVSKQVDSSIASVRFTGTIRENDGPPTPLDEIWHFRQFSPMGDWVVGGVQQE